VQKKEENKGKTQQTRAERGLNFSFGYLDCDLFCPTRRAVRTNPTPPPQIVLDCSENGETTYHMHSPTPIEPKKKKTSHPSILATTISHNYQMPN